MAQSTPSVAATPTAPTPEPRLPVELIDPVETTTPTTPTPRAADSGLGRTTTTAESPMATAGVVSTGESAACEYGSDGR